MNEYRFSYGMLQTTRLKRRGDAQPCCLLENPDWCAIECASRQPSGLYDGRSPRTSIKGIPRRPVHKFRSSDFQIECNRAVRWITSPILAASSSSIHLQVVGISIAVRRILVATHFQLDRLFHLRNARLSSAICRLKFVERACRLLLRAKSR